MLERNDGNSSSVRGVFEQDVWGVQGAGVVLEDEAMTTGRAGENVGVGAAEKGPGDRTSKSLSTVCNVANCLVT